MGTRKKRFLMALKNPTSYERSGNLHHPDFFVEKPLLPVSLRGANVVHSAFRAEAPLRESRQAPSQARKWLVMWAN
jgi:hypothetical protein